MFKSKYAAESLANATAEWKGVQGGTGARFSWKESSTYIQEPPFFKGFSMTPPPVPTLAKLRPLAILGDSVTTDHISPAGAFKEETPAGKFLLAAGVSKKDFNSYGSRRGNDRIMTRGTFANTQVKNVMADGKEGGFTKVQPEGKVEAIYDACQTYAQRGEGMIVFGGVDYGMGSSRDWAAKGTALLGIRAVVAQSFERIHRSNLLGMGVLPLEFADGKNAASYNLDGTETFDLEGLSSPIKPKTPVTLVIRRANGTVDKAALVARIDTAIEGEYYRHGGILPYVLRQILKIGGWEEVALNKDSAGNIAVNPEFAGKNVIPYVWDNTGSNIDLGYRIANAGYPVVLCNVTNLYFDLSYNTDPREPGLYWGGYQDARDPFVLIPFDASKSAVYDQYGQFTGKEGINPSLEPLKPENRKNILGLQAQLWTETVKGPEMMEYYVLPKLFAYAEKAWAPAPTWESDPDMQSRTRRIDSEWNEFANRIGQREFPRLDHLFGGFNYRIPPPGAIIENGMLKANISYPGLTIRYTVDGSVPSVDSPVYSEPVRVNGIVKLAAFSASGRHGRSIGLK
jgi:3-isopropylmalate dehydratase small subunit